MNIFKYLVIVLAVLLFHNACSLPQKFKAEEQPPAPDYSLSKHWSALPFQKDKADKIPKYETWVQDSLKKVDVFYIHPTMYSRGKTWNAHLNNRTVNRRVDKFPIKFQATAFNAVGRVYAPRYRQGHFKSFLNNTGAGSAALVFAYEDVKKAFEYYLEHYNQGRPIIIASHSQGTLHARRLIRDFFDTEEKKKQLVCAYMVGFGIDKNSYEVLRPCETPDDIHCYLTWASYKEGYTLGKKKDLSRFTVGNICINPITWTRDTTKVQGKGATLLRLNRKKLFKVEAQIENHHLLVKTKAPFFRRAWDLHILDYNLFWHEIRSNVEDRVNKYLKNGRDLNFEED